MTIVPQNPYPSAKPELADTDGARSPFDVLLGEITEVLGEWRVLMTPAPWASLPASRLLDSMPEILPGLIRQAAVNASIVDDRLRERIAEDHGLARRTDEMPIAAVAEEWSFLKRACWAVLRRNGVVQQEAESAMRKLELLFDDAVGYTLRGYYRPELDSLKGQGLERRDTPGDRRTEARDRRGSTSS